MTQFDQNVYRYMHGVCVSVHEHDDVSLTSMSVLRCIHAMYRIV